MFGTRTVTPDRDKMRTRQNLGNTKDTEEENMNKLLKDRGFALEDDMSFDEKQNLMEAIRASENAVAEDLHSLSISSSEKLSVENSASRLASLARRKSQGDLHQDKDNENSWHMENEIYSNRKSESEKGRDSDPDIFAGDDDERECVSLSGSEDPERTVTNIENDDEDHNENVIEHPVPSNTLPSTSSKTRNSDDDDDEDDKPRRIFECTLTKTPKKKPLSISLSALKNNPSPRDQTKHLYNGKASPTTKKGMSDFDSLLQPSQRKDLKSKKDQRTSTTSLFQIDVSSENCSMHNYNITLPRKDRKQVANSFPFDLLERGCDAPSFVARFKTHVNKHLKNMYEIQRNSTTFMEWSKPTPIKVLTHAEMKKRTVYEGSGSRAYNFRDRSFGKNFPSDSEDVYDEAATDKPSGSSGNAEMMIDDDEDFEPQSVKRAAKRTKKKAPQINGDEATGNVQPIKRRRNNRKAESKDSATPENTQSSENCPSPQPIEESHSQENNTIEVNGDEDEVSVVYDKNTPVEVKPVPNVQCPICSKMFSNTEIENHASECDQFEGKDAEDPVKANNDDFIKVRPRRALRN